MSSLIIVVLICVTAIESSLMESSSNKIVELGGNVTFCCSTNDSRPIRWERHSNGLTKRDIVFNGEKITADLQPRYSVSITRTGAVNISQLSITAVEINDAGIYACREEWKANGEIYLAELNILTVNHEGRATLNDNNRSVSTNVFCKSENSEDDTIDDCNRQSPVGMIIAADNQRSGYDPTTAIHRCTLSISATDHCERWPCSTSPCRNNDPPRVMICSDNVPHFSKTCRLLPTDDKHESVDMQSSSALWIIISVPVATVLVFTIITVVIIALCIKTNRRRPEDGQQAVEGQYEEVQPAVNRPMELRPVPSVYAALRNKRNVRPVRRGQSLPGHSATSVQISYIVSDSE